MTTPSTLSRKQAFLVLNALPHIGPVTLNRLLADLDDDPRAVLACDTRRLESFKGVGPKIAETLRSWETHVDLAREEERLASAKASFVTADDPDYPPLLREIHDPPIGLYRLGGFTFDRPCVALVGSRRTTLYGQTIAKSLGAELARLGFCVVSGLARGVDTAAHEGALSVGGVTAAVLGNGVDIVYPPENLDLYRRISATGAVLSEFPFGRRADKSSFAMRNRIISGVCKGVVVVESDVDGGSMITARFAGEQGRSILAVPGRIDQATSRGCHQLIRDGATLVTGVHDILEELNYLADLMPAASATQPAPHSVDPALPEDEKLLLQTLAGGELLSPDAIAEKLGQSASVVSANLMLLELKSLVVRRADGTYEAR